MHPTTHSPEVLLGLAMALSADPTLAAWAIEHPVLRQIVVSDADWSGLTPSQYAVQLTRRLREVRTLEQTRGEAHARQVLTREEIPNS